MEGWNDDGMGKFKPCHDLGKGRGDRGVGGSADATVYLATENGNYTITGTGETQGQDVLIFATANVTVRLRDVRIGENATYARNHVSPLSVLNGKTMTLVLEGESTLTVCNDSEVNDPPGLRRKRSDLSLYIQRHHAGSIHNWGARPGGGRERGEVWIYIRRPERGEELFLAARDRANV